MIQLKVNGQAVAVNAAPDTPLLWALREQLNLTGTKFGCGIAQCGACTVHVDGEPTRSCVLPLSAVAGRSVTTVEGLMTTPTGQALQAAWVKEQAPQCGYCQSGQLMTAAKVVQGTKKLLSRAEILEAMSGHVCRCGTYNQIAAAVSTAQKTLTGAKA
ncbi:(2Fe-2S)-binding protein [Macromonas nakdongensis]|uniref:(2Fe-2S)-binding protein n=1 Tax=Macromonas nakdongensis TaxID=1843082 RepID=UPI000C3294E2|nr:(2Fe-2S)-binding protein [Macromonas nakdongensis]